MQKNINDFENFEKNESWEKKYSHRILVFRYYSHYVKNIFCQWTTLYTRTHTHARTRTRTRTRTHARAHTHTYVFISLRLFYVLWNLNYRERVSTGWDSTAFDWELRRMQLWFRRARRMFTEGLRGTASWDFNCTRYTRGARQWFWSFQLSAGSRHRWEFLKHNDICQNAKNLHTYYYRDIMNVVEKSSGHLQF